MGLFDKIVAKASEVGADAAREASKAAESGPIKLSVRGLQGKREEAVTEFGAAALALYREGQISHASLDAIAAKVAGIEQEISTKEAQLQTIEEKYKNPKE